MRMHKLQLATLVAAGVVLAAIPALAADNTNQKQGSAVVTKSSPENWESLAGSPQQDRCNLKKLTARDSTITGWSPLRGPESSVEMVVLIDDGAPQESRPAVLPAIAKFIQGTAARMRRGCGCVYGQRPTPCSSGPLTTDRAAAARELHLPVPGWPAPAPARTSASPIWPGIGPRPMPAHGAKS